MYVVCTYWSNEKKTEKEKRVMYHFSNYACFIVFRTTHQRKKTDELISAEPWLLAFLLAFVFLEGHYMGKRNDQKIAEAMNKHQ